MWNAVTGEVIGGIFIHLNFFTLHCNIITMNVKGDKDCCYTTWIETTKKLFKNYVIYFRILLKMSTFSSNFLLNLSLITEVLNLIAEFLNVFRYIRIIHAILRLIINTEIYIRVSYKQHQQYLKYSIYLNLAWLV